MTSPPDDRSPVAVASAWASRIITVCLEMVLPGVIGYWLDHRLGTIAVFTFLGFGGGLALGLWQLLRMTRSDEAESSNEDSRDL